MAATSPGALPSVPPRSTVNHHRHAARRPWRFACVAPRAGQRRNRKHRSEHCRLSADGRRDPRRPTRYRRIACRSYQFASRRRVADIESLRSECLLPVLRCSIRQASREKALLSQWEVGVGLVAGGGPRRGEENGARVEQRYAAGCHRADQTRCARRGRNHRGRQMMRSSS